MISVPTEQATFVPCPSCGTALMAATITTVLIKANPVTVAVNVISHQELVRIHIESHKSYAKLEEELDRMELAKR